ncbi:MAG: hypothetical protein A3F67_09990 [Verrucomicrobia bacterium RIFCSPHIGHO2_12_FULL_41_10]|nr:MAG: hypothetical protein A3F67_09990 [Verrucomicrobia bacterium RIFCSPHIGHO2_12_FULL_41_10]
MNLQNKIKKTEIAVVFLFLILIVGCQKKKTVEERLTLPRGKYDTAIMANGATVSAEVHSLESTNDALTAASLPASYELHFTLNVAIPTPATTFTTLSAATPDIEKALPDLKSMLFDKALYNEVRP